MLLEFHGLNFCGLHVVFSASTSSLKQNKNPCVNFFLKYSFFHIYRNPWVGCEASLVDVESTTVHKACYQFSPPRSPVASPNGLQNTRRNHWEGQAEGLRSGTTVCTYVGIFKIQIVSILLNPLHFT